MAPVLIVLLPLASPISCHPLQRGALLIGDTGGVLLVPPDQLIGSTRPPPDAPGFLVPVVRAGDGQTRFPLGHEPADLVGRVATEDRRCGRVAPPLGGDDCGRDAAWVVAGQPVRAAGGSWLPRPSRARRRCAASLPAGPRAGGPRRPGGNRGSPLWTCRATARRRRLRPRCDVDRCRTAGATQRWRTPGPRHAGRLCRRRRGTTAAVEGQPRRPPPEGVQRKNLTVRPSDRSMVGAIGSGKPFATLSAM